MFRSTANANLDQDKFEGGHDDGQRDTQIFSIWDDDDAPMSWSQKVSILINGPPAERHSINRTRETGQFNEREFRCKLGYRIVSSTPFTLSVALIIMSSAITLGVEANLRTQINTLEICFSNFFLIEVIIRIASLKCRYFWLSIWNVLDLGLAIMSLIPESIYKSDSSRQFRTARLFRLIKLGRIFPRLRALLVGLQNSLTPLFWVSFILILLFYAFAVFVTTVIGHDYYLWEDCDFEAAGVIIEEHPTKEDIRDWFGSIGKSMFTLFQITTGESWGLIVRSVHAQKPLMTPVFILWIGLTNFAFMNIITGIVVDSTIKAVDVSNRRQYEDTKIRPLLMHHLRRIDIDGGGELTQEQIEHALHDEEFREGFQELGVNPDYIPQLFRAFDQDQGGTVDFTEFCHGFLTLDNPIQRKEIALLRGITLHVLRNIKNCDAQLFNDTHDSKIDQSVTSPTPTNNRAVYDKGHNMALQSGDPTSNLLVNVNTDIVPAIQKEITNSNYPTSKLKMSNHTNSISVSPPILDKVKVVTEIMPTNWRPTRSDVDLSYKFKETGGSCPLSLVVEQIRTGIVDTPPVFYIKTSHVATYSKITVTKMKHDTIITGDGKKSTGDGQSIQGASSAKKYSPPNNNIIQTTFGGPSLSQDVMQNHFLGGGIIETKFKKNINEWLDKTDKQLKHLEQQTEMLTETLPAALDLIFSRQSVFEKLLKNQLYELDTLTHFLQGGHKLEDYSVLDMNLSKNQDNFRLDDAPPAYSEHINNTEPPGFTTPFLGANNPAEHLISQPNTVKQKSGEFDTIKPKKMPNSPNKQTGSLPIHKSQEIILRSASRLERERSYHDDHNLPLLRSQTSPSPQEIVKSSDKSPLLKGAP